MQDIESVKNLLEQSRLIVENHEKHLALTGNGFNIIQALRMESDEVRFHTRFLGYLLDPKAGHMQGDKFLNLFFEILGVEKSGGSYKIEIEKGIGNVDAMNVEGGRIDILISSPDRIYAMEVKIYAVEQFQQLERYSNFIKSLLKKEGKVFYLTLNGDESSSNSDFKGYESISFSIHILSWLEQCRIAAIDQPIIRETLTQYISTIKRLTHQNPDDKMSDQIIDLITRSDSTFKAFEAISSSRTKLFQKFGENLVDELKSNLDLEKEGFIIEFSSRKIPDLDSEISFWLPGSTLERVRLYWLGRGRVGLGMHKTMPNGQDVIDLNKRNQMKELLNSCLKFGKDLQIGSAYHNWFWIAEVDELEGEPQLTYDSWEKFKDKEFANKLAAWVIQIAKAYRQVT